ncbi:MAG: radical SAM protein [Clostridia bacterium]|nr:radical SAM protein [Clostridia bacterium]
MSKSDRKKHINIPIFIPHLGCPNNCVFCNQRSISGHIDFDESSVSKEIEEVLFAVEKSGKATDIEIAFFGGSFTGIDRSLMLRLLERAYSYVKDGRVSSIRLSTRPDYIDDEVLDILKKYGVRTIELGLQSMSEKVLLSTKRGHSTEQAETACRLIKKHAFELIGQMMIGLPSASEEDEIMTAKRICELGADGARVYPTVVFYNTELCEMAKSGLYTPIGEDESVIRTKNVLAVFDAFGVPCIRVGLCASENLSSDSEVYGGANHSAIGELAMGELFYDKICLALESIADDGEKNLYVYVPKGAVSKAIGQKRRNINRIKDKYFVKKHIKNIKILENEEIIGYNIKIEFDVIGG